MKNSVRRLYQLFQPAHYTLELSLDKKALSFHGSVTIRGHKKGKPSKRITLHQKKLNIKSAKIAHINKGNEEAVQVTRVNTHDRFDEVRIHTERALYPGEYLLEIQFSGKITDQLQGVYPSTFVDSGEEQTILATQFESHFARDVFPSIDEPEAKATFDLQLTTDNAEAIISNTPIKSQVQKGNLLITRFETTPYMSTYLLAFVVGDLKFIEAKTKSGVIVRTYATSNHVQSTKFALDVAIRCIDFYQEYFGIAYPLSKCDMIALPDFASGAMENWGCITYREEALLVDPKKTTLSNKQWTAMVIAHELAHQWFGNLVTMRWWTDLWLNEGFASWVEFLAIDRLYPEWNMWEQFVLDEQQRALQRDSLLNTHPVEVPVSHPDEIKSIFDVISYSKGASVIHMLCGYLGDETFRNGLRHYLSTNQFSNTDTVDLWAALEEVSGKPVKEFMHTWTSQPGFPLLTVTVDDQDVTINQTRFLANGSNNNPSNEVWPVPLLANLDMPERLNVQSATYKINDSSALLINSGQRGFYRTSYNQSHVKHLGEQIKKGRLRPTERLGILSDMYETSKSGQSDTVDMLHFLENFKDETDYTVWGVIASSIRNLRKVMDDEEVRESMKPYVRSLIKNEISRLGWLRKENDTHFDRLLRPIILGMAAQADDADIIARCRELFGSINLNLSPKSTATHPKELKPKLAKDEPEIDPDLLGVIYGTIARTGNKNDFNKLVKMHNTSILSEERSTIAAALTGFMQPDLIEGALGMINSKNVRLQDVGYWIAYSFLNRHARAMTWDWVKSHWKWLSDNLGGDLSFFTLPIYIARVQTDPKFLEDYKDFFQARLTPGLERSFSQGIEMIELQIAWKQRSLKEVKNYFKKKEQYEK